MIFKQEKDFEDALVALLFEKGWEREVIEYPTEEDLIQNWADILFNNNKQKDRLNDCPLTKTEMAQILDNVNQGRTPVALNDFINGKLTNIVRDNPDDKLHYGKTISLKIYDRNEMQLERADIKLLDNQNLKLPEYLMTDEGTSCC